MAQIDIVTKDDLELFKQDLIREIAALIKPQNHDPKQWLRSVEVRSTIWQFCNDIFFNGLKADCKIPPNLPPIPLVGFQNRTTQTIIFCTITPEQLELTALFMLRKFRRVSLLFIIKIS
jgi:hypothetical protein